MEVRDPVHGSIHLADEEIPIISHPFFQRLRNIKQLGFSEYVFPGATHTRYLHSIGVMDVSSKVFNQLFKETQQSSELLRLKETLRLACLLHDIGHAPLSHSTESVMPDVNQLKLPERFKVTESRQATHEDYTIKSIVDSSFTESFKLATDKFGVDPNAVAELVIGKTSDSDYFLYNGINYFPLLHQLVSSEMDCDRMDYLLRDSYFCGVSYGNFDLDWLIDNLYPTINNGQAYLGISQRAVATFDDFLLSRFHMFLQVYFHYRSVCLEKMLFRYFQSNECQYTIPADIEKYQEHDDQFLKKIMIKSENTWAKRVIMNKIPRKVFEAYGNQDAERANKLEQALKENNIDYIKCSSKGRLSKYYTQNIENNPQHSIKVIKHDSLTKKITQSEDINKATDLYARYSGTHSVLRIHCDFDELPSNLQNKVKKVISSNE